MKKGLSLLLAATVAFGTVPAVAEAGYAPSYVSVVVNGKKVWFPDAHPFVNSDYRTMVPVRFITESLGANVQWLGDTQTVAIQYKGKDIKLRVGQPKATVDGTDKALDTSVILHNNRTFVPLRFVTESLEGQVSWDGTNQQVTIKTDAFDANAQYDSYGRKIRTTNLPKNAQNYPYILEDVSNGFYEMRKTEEPDGLEVLTTKQLFQKPEFSKENVDKWMDMIRKHYALILNMDYRTINSNWADEAYQYRAHNMDHLYFLKDYVNWVKENKIIVEGYLQPEPSMIVDTSLGDTFKVPAHVKFRFVSFNKYETLLYDQSFDGAKMGPFEKGVWYEGFVDVEMMSEVGGDWAPYVKINPLAMLFNNAMVWKSE